MMRMTISILMHASIVGCHPISLRVQAYVWFLAQTLNDCDPSNILPFEKRYDKTLSFVGFQPNTNKEMNHVCVPLDEVAHAW